MTDYENLTYSGIVSDSFEIIARISIEFSTSVNFILFMFSKHFFKCC